METHCIKVSDEIDNTKGTGMQIKMNIRLVHTMLEYIPDEATSPPKEELITLLQSP